MKKNLLRLSVWAATLLMASTLTSCVTERDETPAAAASGDGNLYITINPESIGQTRAGTVLNTNPSNESYFGKTIVALFDGSETTSALVGEMKEIDNLSGAASTTVTFSGGTYAAGYTVVVASNIPGDASTAPYKTLKDATTLGDFTAATMGIKDVLNSEVLTSTDDYRRLPMFGSSTITSIDADYYANVVVKHSLAKVTLDKLAVDFSESKFRNAKFTPKQVFLVNVPDETNIITTSIKSLTISGSDNKMYQGDYYMNYRTAASSTPEAIYPDADYAKVKITTLTTDNVIGTEELTESALTSGDVWSKSFYFYTLANNNATYPTYLVVGGTFDQDGTGASTSTVYYSAKLNGTDDGTNNYQVQPNYNYKVNMLLRKMGGVDAYTAGDDPTVVNVSVTATAFTDNSINASFGGGDPGYQSTSAAVMTSSGVPVKVGDILFQSGKFVSKGDVADYITENGSDNPVGIVFHLLNTGETYNDGTTTYSHGLVMALNESTTSAGTSTPVKWSTSTPASLALSAQIYLPTHSSTTAPAVGSAELISLETQVAGSIKSLTTTGNNGLTNWLNAPSDKSTLPAFNSVSGFTAVTGAGTSCSNWFLPSVGEWYKICYSLGKLDATMCQGAWNNATWGDNTGTTDGNWTTYGMFYYNGTAADPTNCNLTDGGAADYTRAAINTAMRSAVGAGNYEPIFGGLHPDADNVVDNNAGTPANYGAYWTSSEWSAGFAFRVHFGTGGTLNFGRSISKSNTYRVRPVLAF